MSDVKAISKGGFISESVLVCIHPPKNISNHYSKYLSLGWNSQDSDLAHFLEDGKTL